MLKITKIKQNGGEAAQYYTEGKEHYYTKSKELPGIWYGGQSLGLNGEVSFSEFQNILQGKNKNGEAVVQGAGEKHRPGWDLTFSAPKSLSLYYVAANEETKFKIDKLWHESINKTLDYMQKFYMNDSVRRGKGGVVREAPKELVFAKFDHCTSRANDPQIHTHVVMANLALREDGTYGTIEPDRIYKVMKEIGAIQRAEFIQGLQKDLGLEIERDKESFRIKDFSKEVKLVYSKRSIEIERKIREQGAKTGAQKDYIKTITREKKSALSREDNISKWNAELKEKGIDENFTENLKGKYRDGFYKKFKDNVAKQSKDELVKNCIDKLTKSFSTITEVQMKKEIAIESQGFYGLDEIKEIHSDLHLEKFKSIVYLGKDEFNQKRYTTNEIQKIELEMIEHAKEIYNKKTISVSLEEITLEKNRVVDGKSLFDEQKLMLEYVLSEENLKIVQGAAGAGKSFALERVKDVYENKGYTVLGLAPTGIASENLNGNKINTITLDKYFFDKLNNIDAIKIDKNTVVIVDEAGMIGSRKMDLLLKEVNKVNAKIILVGDSEQLQSIDYGGAFKALKDRFDFVEMLDTRRQQIEWQKSAANLIRNGHTNEALILYGSNGKLTIEKAHEDAKIKIVNDYLNERALSPEKSKIIMAFYNKDTNHINEIIHQKLKNKNEIKNSYLLEVVDRNKQIQEKEFSIGERIVCTKNSNKYGVKNGSLGTILEVNHHNIKVKLDNKKVVEIDTQNYKNIDYGYAITIHKSQGTTFDSARVLLTENIDKQLLYVLATRHRENLDMYISQESFPNLEMTNTHGEKELAEVIYELANVTKRSSVKDTSLDYKNENNLDNKNVSHRKTIKNNLHVDLKTPWHDAAIKELKETNDLNKKFDILYKIATKERGSIDRLSSPSPNKAEYQKKAEQIIHSKKITEKNIAELESHIKNAKLGKTPIVTKKMKDMSFNRNRELATACEKAKLFNTEFITKKQKQIATILYSNIEKIPSKELVKYALEIATIPRAIDRKYCQQNWTRTSFQIEAERLIKNKITSPEAYKNLGKMMKYNAIGNDSFDDKYIKSNEKYNNVVKNNSQWLEKKEEKETLFVTKSQKKIGATLIRSENLSDTEKLSLLSQFLSSPRAVGPKYKEINFEMSPLHKQATDILYSFSKNSGEKISEFGKNVINGKLGNEVENKKVIEIHNQFYAKKIQPCVEKAMSRSENFEHNVDKNHSQEKNNKIFETGKSKQNDNGIEY